jgi:site-specific DNA-methyltransferase (adenine-specific)
MTPQFQFLPDLSPEQFSSLKADIAQRGVLIPVEVDETGAVLDGHHRVRAWRELRDEGLLVPSYPRVVRFLPDEESKIVHALRLNLSRRH